MQAANVESGVSGGEIFAELQFIRGRCGKKHLVARVNGGEEDLEVFSEVRFAGFDRAEKGDRVLAVWREARRQRQLVFFPNRRMGGHGGIPSKPAAQEERRGEIKRAAENPDPRNGEPSGLFQSGAPIRRAAGDLC